MPEQVRILWLVGVRGLVFRRVCCGTDGMRERVADKLLFVMPIAPVLFRGSALAQAFVENQLTKAAQIIEFANLVR